MGESNGGKIITHFDNPRFGFLGKSCASDYYEAIRNLERLRFFPAIHTNYETYFQIEFHRPSGNHLVYKATLDIPKDQYLELKAKGWV